MAVLILGACELLFAPTTIAQNFAEIPVTVKGLSSPDPQAPWHLAIETDDPIGLAARLQEPSPDQSATNLRYALSSAYRPVKTNVTRTWLEPTVVIDHDDSRVQALRDQWLAGHSTQSLQSLVTFVATLIDEKTTRGFDFASTVAQRREGDCTEHAVLTAALARSAGMRARVVLGTALLRDKDGFRAYGHAWAELWQDGTWVVADAALSGLKAQLRYVPASVLEDEGHGFAFGLIQALHFWTNRIEIHGGAQVIPKIVE
jgi:transglutaminase-like putative cysteine protease